VATEIIQLEQVFFEVAHYEHHSFQQHDRTLREEVVDDDIDKRRVKRVRVDGQEALHRDQTQVNGQRVQVVQQLWLFGGEQLVDQLDVCAQREHVRVVVSRHELFDHVDQDPETLFFRELFQYEKSYQPIQALAVADLGVSSFGQSRLLRIAEQDVGQHRIDLRAFDGCLGSLRIQLDDLVELFECAFERLDQGLVVLGVQHHLFVCSRQDLPDLRQQLLLWASARCLCSCRSSGICR
jgi:hypothetical protein